MRTVAPHRTEAKDLLRHVIVKNPAQRLTLQEIWNHPWYGQRPQSTSHLLWLFIMRRVIDCFAVCDSAFFLPSFRPRLADPHEVLDLAVPEPPADIKEKALQKMTGTVVAMSSTLFVMCTGLFKFSCPRLLMPRCSFGYTTRCWVQSRRNPVGCRCRHWCGQRNVSLDRGQTRN